MDVVERIKSELSSSPVVLFMKGTPDFPQCGFSAQTVQALRLLGANFKHVNIFEDPELREALKRYSNWPTYPQLYVNGELVGHRNQAEPWWQGDYRFEWDVDLTGRLRPGPNEIALRGFNPHHFGGLFRRPFVYAPR